MKYNGISFSAFSAGGNYGNGGCVASGFPHEPGQFFQPVSFMNQHNSFNHGALPWDLSFLFQ